MTFYRFGYYFSTLIAIGLGLMLIDSMKHERRVSAVEKAAPAQVSGKPAPAREPAPNAAPAPIAAVSPAQTSSPSDDKPHEAADDDSEPRRGQFRINARIGSIERFVQLTDAQRERLAEKFRADFANRDGEAKDGESSSQSLDDIIGAENAQYYRDQTKQAFARAKAESDDREIFYQSRKLGLTSEQEEQYRAAIAAADAQIEQAREPELESGGMRARMRRMFREDAMRDQIVGERLQQILSAEQYQRYLEQQQNSTTADFGVFHGM